MNEEFEVKCNYLFVITLLTTATLYIAPKGHKFIYKAQANLCFEYK